MRRNCPGVVVVAAGGPGRKLRNICSQSQQYGNPDLLRRNPRPPQRSQYFSS
jgi:hypothetical protein